MNETKANCNGKLESRFENGIYNGYEVRLLVERTVDYEPHPVRNASEIYGFMAELSRENAEHVYELLMDIKHRVTGVYLVGKGGIDKCQVEPVEIYKAAFATNSPCFALVHNHPSGDASPSVDDRNLVARIQGGAEIVGLEFLDFVIIGNGSYCSFMELGLLPRRRT